MRVPIPVVMVLVLAVVGGMWWYHTREMDFMTPPTVARLEAIRVKTESSFPRAEEFDDTMAIPAAVPPPPPSPPEPAPDLGDLSQPPTLAAYRDRADHTGEDFIKLAEALEEHGDFPRALLAWERVIDSTRAMPDERATAISSIKRLRPTLPAWNADPALSIRIQLVAGTSRSLAGKLEPVLKQISGEIPTLTSGVVTADSKVTASKSRQSGKNPTPVALSITGSDKNSTSTGVLSFTVGSPEELHDEIWKTIFQLVHNHLGKSARFPTPEPLAEGESPAEALAIRVTRLQWNDFASALNAPAATE